MPSSEKTIKLAKPSIKDLLLHKLTNVPILRRVLKYTYRRRILNELIEAYIPKLKELHAIDFASKFLVKDVRWANSQSIRSKDFLSLTQILTLIDITLMQNRLVLGIPPSLHWSRKFEYPYALLMSGLFNESYGLVLDIGAGTNPLQILLALKGFHVISLDNNPAYYIKLQKIRIRRLHPCFGDALSLPFKDNTFHYVIFISVLEHILDHLNPEFSMAHSLVITMRLVDEIYRVTRPGGKIVMTFDVNFSTIERRHLTLKEAKLLCSLLGVELPPIPSNLLLSKDSIFGKYFAENEAVLCLILEKKMS